MGALRTLKRIGLLLLLTAVTNSVALAAGSTGKAYAVFMAAYNGPGQPVRGGVCGTLFFTSAQDAVTAYHVLKPSSFQPPQGFRKVRIWLVHEGEAPIEVRPEYLSYRKERDLTRLRLPVGQAVPRQHIFATTARIGSGDAVETEGFPANSTGPQLAWEGDEVKITSVPTLSRVRMSGKVLRQARIELKAADLELKSSPNVELSYHPVVGLSGGPVIAHGKVVAMNSFADPESFTRTWALRLNSDGDPLLNP